jgi:hypothetical protein
LIVIVTTQQHSYTHKCLLDEPELDVRLISYARLEQSKERLPPATYVFTDLDRLPPPSLYAAALRYRELRAKGYRVLNDPACAMKRFGLLRALSRAGLNDFDAYSVESLERPTRWPVFLRLEGDHERPVSGLLSSPEELDEAVRSAVDAGFPRSAMIIVEYAAEPVIPGLYRKLSVFRVGDRMLGYTCVHEDQWLVKYGKKGIATPELYEAEYQLVAENPYGPALREVFDLAGIEYGRADFGLVDGKPQIYEINSNPNMKLRDPDPPNARRGDSNELFRTNYIAAMQAIDSGTSAKPVQGRRAAQ